MFKWKCRFQLPQINLESYKDVLRRELIESLSRGVFEWLDSVLSVIPTWSGASRATFLHLSREISYPLVVSPVRSAPDRRNLGENQSHGDFDTSQIRNGRVFFTYSTKLEHLIYNEFNNANVTPDRRLYSRLLQPGPYGFQQRGQDAFLRVAAQTELPNLSRHIRVRFLKVGR